MVNKYPRLSVERIAELNRTVRLGDVVLVTGAVCRNQHGHLEMHMDDISVLISWKASHPTVPFKPEPVSVQVVESDEVCKYWITTGTCVRQHCRYRHTASEGEREAWVQERIRCVGSALCGR